MSHARPSVGLRDDEESLDLELPTHMEAHVAIASDDARMIACPLCGVPYPAQYGGCPRCVERDRTAWKAATTVVLVLLALYAIAHVSGLLTVVASRF